MPKCAFLYGTTATSHIITILLRLLVIIHMVIPVSVDICL